MDLLPRYQSVKSEMARFCFELGIPQEDLHLRLVEENAWYTQALREGKYSDDDQPHDRSWRTEMRVWMRLFFPGRPVTVQMFETFPGVRSRKLKEKLKHVCDRCHQIRTVKDVLNFELHPPIEPILDIRATPFDDLQGLDVFADGDSSLNAKLYFDYLKWWGICFLPLIVIVVIACMLQY